MILYDRLVNLELLEEVRPDAERIFAGKGPGCHTLAQEEINALLVARARQGRVVARLKGGDPFVFGRGGEEAAALAEAGIPFEVVPGITSAVAVPAYAGIPVTHRGLAAQLTIVSGHEGATHSSPAVDWEKLAGLDGTLVILMGLAALPEITRRLLAAGMASGTPAAVIQHGTLADQRVVTGTLADISARTTAEALRSPSVIVIGAVAGLRESLAWYKPLVAQYA